MSSVCEDCVTDPSLCPRLFPCVDGCKCETERRVGSALDRLMVSLSKGTSVSRTGLSCLWGARVQQVVFHPNHRGVTETKNPCA